MNYTIEYVKEWRRIEFEAGRDSSLLAFAIAHEETTRKQAIKMNFRLDLLNKKAIHTLA